METETVAALRLQISQLEAENDAILQERDRFLSEVKAFRDKVNGLESRVEDLTIQNGDLKRKLARKETLPPSAKVEEIVGSSKLTLGTSKTNTRDAIEVDIDKESTVVTASSLTKGSQSLPTSRSSSSSLFSPSVSQYKRALDAIAAEDLEARSVKKIKRPSVIEGSISSTRPPPVQHDKQSRPVEPPSSLPEIVQKKGPVKRPAVSTIKRPTQPSASAPPKKNTAPRREGLKVQQESLILPYIIWEEYLKGCAPLRINSLPPPTLFKRLFLSSVLGGSAHSFRASSNYLNRQILFPTLDYHPDGPIHPGSPGLMLCSRTDVIGRFTVFSRVQEKPPMWEYMGEYKTSHVDQLPASIFDRQTQEMKDLWANVIDKKTWSPYPEMRKRIADQQKGKLTHEDIIEALEQGDEQLGVLKMECVMYDHEFFAHLMKNLKAWTPQTQRPSSE